MPRHRPQILSKGQCLALQPDWTYNIILLSAANLTMAEIGLAASILTVIQISEDVITRAYKYGKAVKNAENDINKVNKDLQDVRNILTKLETLAKQAESSGRPLTLWPTLISLKEENGPLSQCKSALISLQGELAPAEGWAKFRRRLQWPHKAKDVGKLVEIINAQKKYFLEALSIDGAYVDAPIL
jgi:hypothetical protein